MTSYGAILAARMGSTRLPGKATLPILGIPSLAFLIRRLKPAREIAGLVLATTTRPDDDVLAELGAAEGIAVYRGPVDDVVARYAGAAERFGFDKVVRVTGDCPFLDARTLDFCVSRCRDDEAAPIASTKTIWPVGIDYEIYDARLMAELNRGNELSRDDREHLTKFMYDRPDRYRCRRIAPMPGIPAMPADMTFTLDTKEDYAFLTAVADAAADPMADTAALLRRALALRELKPRVAADAAR